MGGGLLIRLVMPDSQLALFFECCWSDERDGRSTLKRRLTFPQA
jgi:hypothetical protein